MPNSHQYEYYRSNPEDFFAPRIIIALKIYQLLNSEAAKDAKNDLTENQKNFLVALKDIDIVEADRTQEIEKLVKIYFSNERMPANIEDLARQIDQICKKVDSVTHDAPEAKAAHKLAITSK